jgi:hypothetical protein
VDLDDVEESMDEQAEKAEKPEEAEEPEKPAEAGSIEEKVKRAESMKPEAPSEEPAAKDEEKYGPHEEETETLATSPAEEGLEPAPGAFSEEDEVPSPPPEPTEPPEVKEPEPAPEPSSGAIGEMEPIQLPAENEDAQASSPAPGVAPGKPKPRKPMDTSAALSTITSADLAQSPKDYIGRSISMEGIIKLSSRGKKDVWYVLFDDTGSAVVRSGEDIPTDKVRVFAEIKETRLGQTYLDVLKYEKA